MQKHSRDYLHRVVKCTHNGADATKTTCDVCVMKILLSCAHSETFECTIQQRAVGNLTRLCSSTKGQHHHADVHGNVLLLHLFCLFVVIYAFKQWHLYLFQASVFSNAVPATTATSLQF